MTENQRESTDSPTRPPYSGPIPEISVEGSVDDAGEMLGAAWREALQLEATSRDDARTPCASTGPARTRCEIESCCGYPGVGDDEPIMKSDRFLVYFPYEICS